MTPETYIVSFWRPGSEDYCPPVSIGEEMEYAKAAEICASLIARGYLVQVFELRVVEVPAVNRVGHK